jgi:hypothetical protein
MVQTDTPAQSPPEYAHISKHKWPFISSGILIAVFCAGTGFWTGFMYGQKSETIHPIIKIVTKKQIITKTVPVHVSAAAPYTLTYTMPQGFTTLVWHPTAKSSSVAFASPDYLQNMSPAQAARTGIHPQTGMAIYIYRVPEPCYSLSLLKATTESTEENLQELTQTTVGGQPAYYAEFIDTDSYRILFDYHILKGTDQWVIRYVFPGINLQAAQTEEQKYSQQINAFLQSFQFQQYYF